MNCQDSIPLSGNKIHVSALLISKAPLLFVGKQHRDVSSRELFGISTPLVFSLFKMVYQCYFQCWRGTVSMKFQKSICPLQRMRCLQGERKSHSLHSPCSPAENVADAAELPWIFCARASNHSVFPWVQMTCGHAVNWECRHGGKSGRAQWENSNNNFPFQSTANMQRTSQNTQGKGKQQGRK